MTTTQQGATRRDFLKTSAATAAAGVIISPASFAKNAWVGGVDETLRVGLVGCGGRGSGAATQALRADKNAKLVAMGDAFSDRLDGAWREIQGKQYGVADQISVDDGHKFTGVDCHKQVIDSGVDVVILCSPPHFRPAQIEYAVEKGVHVFAEKPVAVDAPGVRRVMAACEAAKAKNLTVVSGLCWRYHAGMRATFDAVHQGGIGDIVAMQATYNTGALWNHARKPEWTDLEWQLRNWLYFTWLSGDHIVEQHIHSLDKMLWAMKDVVPVRATGAGGRQVRTDPAFGHIYDHFSIVYEWENGVKGFSACRQLEGCSNDVSDHLFGTRGRCDVFKHRISGEKPWKFEGKSKDMYQQEHDELFASIRAGKPINDGDYMCKSTQLAILGRMAAYTGQTLSWDQALASKEDLTPSNYEGASPTPPVAMPGFTRFM